MQWLKVLSENYLKEFMIFLKFWNWNSTIFNDENIFP